MAAELAGGRHGVVRLRTAVPADREVLESWDRQEHVIAASGEDDTFDWAAELPRCVPWRELLMAEEDGRPVGFLQVIDPRDEETHYWGDIDPGLRAIDIWIGDPADLGRGIGTVMMRLALRRCFADPGVQAVLIDPLLSNVAAQRFYRRIGFTDVGVRDFDADRCLVMRLDRDRWAAGPAGRSLVERLGLPPDARAVVVNADDLGMCHASTIGCLDALRHGAASSASLMVPCPWASFAAASGGDVDVGVHLTLNAEWEHYRWGPLTGGATLRVADGGFPRSVRHVIEHADLDEVRAELRAQLDRALAWGVDVSHLDAHMYTVQDDPRLAAVYLDLAVEYALPVRLSGSAATAGPLRERAAALGVVVPDHLVPLPAMGSRRPLLQALASLPAGVTELHAHPAIDTPELRALAPDWATRVDDLDLLRPGGALDAALAASGAVVVGYRALRDVMREG